MTNTKNVDAEDTREKICEAQYFLDGMGAYQNDPNRFKYNLSAFLSAFRSIRDFMDEELEDTKLDACNQKLQSWMESDAKITLLRKCRNITTHHHSITGHDLDIHLTTTPFAEVKAFPVSVHIVDKNGSIQHFTSSRNIDEKAPTVKDEDKSWTGYTWYFMLHEKMKDIKNIDIILQKDVISICQNSFEELMRRIASCDEGLLKPIC